MNMREKILVGDAVDFYEVVQKQVFVIGKRVLDTKYPDGGYPVPENWRFRDGFFEVTFGSSWGRTCRCCEPERLTIKVPWPLLWAEEEELGTYLATLPTDGEDYDEEVM